MPPGLQPAINSEASESDKWPWVPEGRSRSLTPCLLVIFTFQMYLYYRSCLLLYPASRILQILMAKIQTPEGMHNPPKLPLPWRPSERAKINHDVFMDKENRCEDLRDYLQAIHSQYIITDIGVHAVEMAVGYMSIGAHVFYGEDRADMSAEDMQREFEQEVLGLDPLPYGNGLHFRVSRAGFSGGTYPIEPFADLVGIDTQEFSEILHDDKLVRFGHVILRSADYIVPVKKSSSGDKALVSANNATKLNETGNALVDIALNIADYSTHP